MRRYFFTCLEKDINLKDFIGTEDDALKVADKYAQKLGVDIYVNDCITGEIVGCGYAFV